MSHPEGVEAIVIDNGSGILKAGFSGEDMPRSIFSTSVGSVKDPEAFAPLRNTLKNDNREANSFVGNDCQLIREHLTMVNPIERGEITDWDAMERIWDFTFNKELMISPDTTSMPLLMTEKPLNRKENQEKMAQIMFESFKVSGFYLIQQCVLSLFASGRTRGLVVESGYGSSQAVPIFEGYALPHAILHLDVGGQDITQQLKRSLAKQDHVFSSAQTDIVRDIKETNCYLKYNGCKLVAEDKQYELPDGSIIKINEEDRVDAAEVLFSPNLLGENHPAATALGLHKIVHKCLSMCDKDLQNDLHKAVVLAGGTSMLPGFPERMHEELSKLDQNREFRIIPNLNGRERGYNSQRKYASWVGGSMFASLPTFNEIYITKQEWEEYHESIVHRKIF